MNNRAEALLDKALDEYVEIVKEYQEEAGVTVNEAADGEVEEYLASCIEEGAPARQDELLQIISKHTTT